LPLCDRCGEEIALANDLDQARDIDRRRHVLLVAGKSRRLSPSFWRLFTLLYRTAAMWSRTIGYVRNSMAAWKSHWRPTPCVG
jgi:hypothetical protein